MSQMGIIAEADATFNGHNILIEVVAHNPYPPRMYLARCEVPFGYKQGSVLTRYISYPGPTPDVAIELLKASLKVDEAQQALDALRRTAGLVD